jgi:hypothetical protein
MGILTGCKKIAVDLMDRSRAPWLAISVA